MAAEQHPLGLLSLLLDDLEDDAVSALYQVRRRV